MVAVEVDEGLLGVVEAVERARPGGAGRGRCGGRPARSGVPVGASRPCALPACCTVRSRKLASSRRPHSVQIDSGWNCTPQSGRVRCASAHQHAVAGPRRALELLRQRLGDAERVVAHHLEVLRDAGEQRRVVVVDGAEPAVHHLGRVHDLAAGEVRRRPDGRGRRRAAARRRSRIASAQTPKSLAWSGRPGPGEMTMLSKSPPRPAPPRLPPSLRTTIGSSPFASASSWKRL